MIGAKDSVDTDGANGDPRPHEYVIDHYPRYEAILGPGPPQAFTNLISSASVAPVGLTHKDPDSHTPWNPMRTVKLLLTS